MGYTKNERDHLYSEVNRRHGRIRPGVHNIVTEAQTLEEACDIIEAHQNRAKARKGIVAAAARPRNLRQQFADAKLRAYNNKLHGKISLAGGIKNKPDPRVYRGRTVLPHPFRDLPEDQKPIRARQMADSGAWGVGSPMIDRLAKLFSVGRGQVVEWLANES